MKFNFKHYAHSFQINLDFLDFNWIMTGINSLHGDIMVLLLLIMTAIGYCVIRIYMCSLVKSLWCHTISISSHISLPKKAVSQNKKYYNNEVILEIIWTIIPMLILILIGFLTMSFIYNLCNYVYLPNYTIGVTGHQWYWDYSYNDYNLLIESFLVNEDYLLQGDLRLLEVDNRLIIPSQSHVRMFVTSDDVIHSWAVPSLGIKIDANPGRMNHCHLFINNYIGTFYGQCSELCGTGHSSMPISVQAIPNWLFKYVITPEMNEFYTHELTTQKLIKYNNTSHDNFLLISIDESLKKKELTQESLIKYAEEVHLKLLDAEVNSFIEGFDDGVKRVKAESRKVHNILFDELPREFGKVELVNSEGEKYERGVRVYELIYDAKYGQLTPSYEQKELDHRLALLYEALHDLEVALNDLKRHLLESGFTNDQLNRVLYDPYPFCENPDFKYLMVQVTDSYGIHDCPCGIESWTEFPKIRNSAEQYNIVRTRLMYIDEVLPNIKGDTLTEKQIKYLEDAYFAKARRIIFKDGIPFIPAQFAFVSMMLIAAEIAVHYYS